MTTTEDRGEVFRRTDRTDAPLYLARYSERRARHDAAPVEEDDDESLPLYLRRFRDRTTGAPSRKRSVPLEHDGERFAPEYAAVTRSHEIIPEERSERDGYTT